VSDGWDHVVKTADELAAVKTEELRRVLRRAGVLDADRYTVVYEARPIIDRKNEDGGRET
jgi:hypothetical protein